MFPLYLRLFDQSIWNLDMSDTILENKRYRNSKMAPIFKMAALNFQVGLTEKATFCS
jgi:hypothetical protein